MPEVYAARAYKQLKKLKDPELATWGLRMLVEARILRPADVKLPTLHNPEKYPESVLRVYCGLQLLFQSKWHYDFGASTPLSWRFGAAWCRVSQEYFMKGLRVLLSRGIIWMDGNFNDKGDFIPKTHKGQNYLWCLQFERGSDLLMQPLAALEIPDNQKSALIKGMLRVFEINECQHFLLLEVVLEDLPLVSEFWESSDKVYRQHSDVAR